MSELAKLFAPSVPHTTYPFPLSDGRLAEIRLPERLTRRDAERIKRLLDAVVIEPVPTESTTPP